MTTINADAIKPGMTICEDGMDAIHVTEVGQHGDTMLITGFLAEYGGAHTEQTLDIDTVVELLAEAIPVVPLASVAATGADWPIPEHHVIAVHLDSYLTFQRLVGKLEGLTIRIEVDPSATGADLVTAGAPYMIGPITNQDGTDWLDLDVLDDDGELVDKVNVPLALVTKMEVL